MAKRGDGEHEVASTFTSVPVDPLLARKLQNAAHRLAEWTKTRDQLVCEARQNGGSLREVAELAGVSHTQVNNIVQAAKKAAEKEAEDR